MPKRGKKYMEASKAFDKQNLYDVNEAMEIVVNTSKAKFDETIEDVVPPEEEPEPEPVEEYPVPTEDIPD